MVALIEKVRDHWKKHIGAAEADSIILRPMLFVERRFINATKSTPAEVVAVATTPAIDLEEETINPDGLDPRYFNTFKAMYYSHDYEALPIATMRKTYREGDGWMIRFHMSALPFAQDVLTLMKEEAINGTSVGIRVKDSGAPTREEMDRFGPSRSHIRSAMWIETSPTPMPCNPEAVITAKADRIEPSDKFLGDLDRLVRLGRVQKSSALKMGLPPVRRKVVLLG